MAPTGRRTVAERISVVALYVLYRALNNLQRNLRPLQGPRRCDEALAISPLLRQGIRVRQDRPKEEREEENWRQQEGWVDPPGHRGERQVHEPHDHEGKGQAPETLRPELIDR